MSSVGTDWNFLNFKFDSIRPRDNKQDQPFFLINNQLTFIPVVAYI